MRKGTMPHRRNPNRKVESLNLRAKLAKLMNAKLLGLFRHLLTFGGGFLVAKGWMDAETLASLVGAAITVIGNVMSVKAPEKAE